LAGTILGMKMSETRALHNRRALKRLNRALPEIFPKSVLIHAFNLRWLPTMPRLAVDAYWRAHVIRADRLSRALAAKSGAPDGWTWRAGSGVSFRAPPAPYREPQFSRGPGFCCVCGQEVYRFGWHADLWDAGPNRRASWHTACVVAWRLWNAPSDHDRMLRRLQARRCAETGGRLWKTAEIDHRVPLFRVWREHHNTPWPELLSYWGVPNLQVINRDVHAAKCAEEARSRSATAMPQATSGPRFRNERTYAASIPSALR
jgi:hypothetical protein